MGMLLSELGNGSGYVYVTLSNGTTIISNPSNTSGIWQQIQKYVSAPLTDPTLQVDATFGYRIFGNTTGASGILAGSTELTRFLVNRASQTASYKKSITIATGVITIDRVTNNMALIVDTEGAIAGDDLDTITSTDVVDNDTITIIGSNSARVVTLKHGTGNIFLSNNADFASGNRQTQITLRYYSAAAAGWYEVSRVNSLPTVANQRAVTVPAPISGVNSTALTNAGGTINLEPGVDKGYQVYTGEFILLASQVIQIQPAPTVPYLDGDEMIVDYRGLITQGVNTVTIFGITLTATQALQGRVILYAKYKLSNTTWYYSIFYNARNVDVTSKSYVDTTFEPVLGSPAADGFILSSLADGTRSWIPNPNGVILTASITLTTAQILDSFTTPIVPFAATGAGQVIKILDVVAFNDFNTTAYAGANSMVVRYTGGATIWSFANTFVNSGADATNSGTQSSAVVMLQNTGVEITTLVANPTLGDGSIKFSFQYRIVNFS